MTLTKKIPPIYPNGIYIEENDFGGQELRIHIERLKHFCDYFHNTMGYTTLLISKSQKGFEYLQLKKYVENLSPGRFNDPYEYRVSDHLNQLQHTYETYKEDYAKKYPKKSNEHW